jgi:PAS domain S-box-containing protein
MTAPERGPRPQPALVVYIGLLAGMATAATIAVSARGGTAPGTPRTASFVVLVGLLIAAEHLFVRFRYRGEISSINLVEAVMAPLLFAWPAADVVVAAALAPLVVAVVRRNQPVKTAFNMAQWALAAATGTALLSDLRPHAGLNGESVIAVSLALAVVGVVNHACFAGVMGVVRRQSPMAVLHDLGPTLAAGWAIGWVVNSLTGLLFVVAYAAHPASVVLFPVPLVVQHLAYRSYAGARTDRLRLAGLHRAARVLAAPFDPAEAVGPYLSEVAAAFEARAVELLVLEGAGAGAGAGLHTWEDGAYDHRALPHDDDSLASGVVGLDGPVRIGVTGHALSRRVEAGGWRNCLAAPLVGDAGTIGALLVLDQGGLEGFEEGELAVMEAFARETAASLVKGSLVAAAVDERRKLSDIVDSTSDALCTVGPDGCVQTWNPACERITGLAASAVVGSRIPVARINLRTLDDEPVILDGMALDRPPPPELRLTALDGREVRLSCAYSLTRAGADQVLVIVARDITSVEEMAQLREQMGELAASEAAHRVVVEQLQEALTPPAPEIEGAELAVAFEASEATSPTGGDLYDWHVLPNGDVHIAVVDVLGHGVKATRDALAVVSSLRILALQGLALDEVVGKADEVLAAGPRELVATVLIARYDSTTGRVQLAGGGHPPALVVSPDGRAHQLPAPGGAIGWPGAGSEVLASAVLQPGDALVLYTDGLVEARKDILEGLDVLVATAKAASPAPSADSLARTLLAACLTGAARRDDSLVLVLRHVGSPVASAAWEFPPDNAAVSSVRAECADWLRAQGVPGEQVEDVRLIASELLTNAVRAARTVVRCRAEVAPGWVRVEVADDGFAVTDEDVPFGPLEAGHDAEAGRGLFIVRTLADDVVVDRLGGETVVRASVGVTLSSADPAPSSAAAD